MELVRVYGVLKKFFFIVLGRSFNPADQVLTFVILPNRKTIKRKEFIIKNLLPEDPSYHTAVKTLLPEYHKGLIFSEQEIETSLESPLLAVSSP